MCFWDADGHLGEKKFRPFLPNHIIFGPDCAKNNFRMHRISVDVSRMSLRTRLCVASLTPKPPRHLRMGQGNGYAVVILWVGKVGEYGTPKFTTFLVPKG